VSRSHSATAPAAELRQPLGYAMVGGLALSQLLTLYTTPVVYLYLDRRSPGSSVMQRRPCPSTVVRLKADSNSRRSNRNPLDLIERDFVAGAVVELGGARAFVRRHQLGVFEGAAGFEVGRYASCPEGVAADLDLQAELS
jgi:hypothetical protein